MHFAPPISVLLYGILLAMGAGLAVYAAWPSRPNSNAWRPLALAMPVIAGAAGVYWAGGIAPAVSLLMAAAVGTQLLINGELIFSAPRPGGIPASAGSPSAALILPTSIVLLLGGFSSSASAAMLIGLAMCAMFSLDLLRSPAADSPVETRGKPWPLAILPLGVIVAVSVQFHRGATVAFPHLAPEVLLISLAAPALLIPTFITCGRLARADLASAIGTSSTVATTCLGLALPLLLLIDLLIRRMGDDLATMGGLPALSWRFDSPLLLAGGFAALGLRVGLLRADRWIGLLLLSLYAAYLMAGTILRLH